MFKNPQYFGFILSLESIDSSFLKRFDIDSSISLKIRDSLQQKGISTGKLLPYKGFSLVINNDVEIPMAVNEYFLAYPVTHYRQFRMISKYPFEDGTLVKIVTGDGFLDKILNNSFFILRVKKKIDVQRSFN